MAADMFIKIGTMVGESKDSQFSQWTQVLAWSWGGSQAGTATFGGGQSGGKVSMQDFSFTKNTDLTSPKLWGRLSEGKHFGNAQFRARKAGGTPFVYMELDFFDVMLTSISTGGAGHDDQTTESVSFTYKKYKIKYTKQADGDSGQADGDDEFTYDLSKNEAA